MSAVLFQGESIRLLACGEGFAELCFDRRDAAINKLDQRSLGELRQALAQVAAAGLRGLLISSAKEAFIVGADVTEFGALFQQPEAALAAWTLQQNRVFNALEDLPLPTVALINGLALGGGLETALAADFRVLSSTAQLGLPEVKLGLIPGFGGTVRLARVAGAQLAIDWISSGAPVPAVAALGGGVADAVVPPETLRATALDWLRQAAGGALDWKARRAAKQAPLPLALEEGRALFAAAKEKVARQAPRQQPAALAAVELMEAAAALGRDAALALEAASFARIARTQAAASLLQIFFNEQQLKKRFKGRTGPARAPKQVAVLGAGIMGGGIAYTSALCGTPVRMKDIQQAQLDLGQSEATSLLARQVKSGRLAQAKADAVFASIRPQLDYAGFDQVDVVVEAVVEKLEVKHAVLAEVERQLPHDAVIASNTSSLRIDALAAPLQRPENFVGMHFFNPVPAMPLVEVIKGSRSSDAAAAIIAGYAVAMGKTPIVVRDCPGFLVNRILTPYMLAFSHLVADGADFIRIDQVMEAFGWPMGPAWLSDVIGLDTAVHVTQIIVDGYPQRMRGDWPLAPELMVRHRRLGQKNGIGFYRYAADASGKTRKQPAADSHALLHELQAQGSRDFDDREIIERMMLPMIVEAATALQDGIVGSAMELDMALLLGIGLPRHLGGALKYADWLGLGEVVAMSERHAALGPMYAVPSQLREMAAAGARYYAA